MFSFEDAWDWGVHPDVVEKLPDGTVLVITGTAEAAATDWGFAGSLDGSFTIYASPSSGEIRSSCTSALHDFRLTR